MGAYKTITKNDKLKNLLDSSEVDELRDEMTEWRDNMEGTGLENTNKYEEVSECADALESIADSFNDAIDELTADKRVKVLFDENVTYTYVTPRSSRRGPARWARASNIASAVGPALDLIEQKVGEGVEAVEILRDQTEELQALDFPGMF